MAALRLWMEQAVCESVPVVQVPYRDLLAINVGEPNRPSPMPMWCWAIFAPVNWLMERSALILKPPNEPYTTTSLSPLEWILLQAAEGIHRIANARTMRALRAVSTERGRDPREFVLMAFGGAGPIHAAGLAKELLIRQVIVPPLPGLFSTLGLLFSGVEHHDVRSCLLSGETLNAKTLEGIKAEMQRNMLAQFETEGYPADQVTLSCSVDIRFKGQASEIRLPMADEHFTETTVQHAIHDLRDRA